MNRRDQFVEHGWLVARGVIGAARIAELERALDELVPDTTYPAWGDRVVEIASISRGAEVFAAHARDPAIAAIAGEALGAASLQLLQDTALIKPAAHPGRVEWHQDYTYLGYLDQPRVITARLALTPCTLELGCLRVLDGSHRWEHVGENLAFRRGEVEDALGALPEALRARAAGAEVALELAPGDVSFHHCLTFHGSAPNGGARPRKTLAVRMFDSACRLVAERLPSPEAARFFPCDADGRLDPDAFPILWSA